MTLYTQGNKSSNYWRFLIRNYEGQKTVVPHLSRGKKKVNPELYMQQTYALSRKSKLSYSQMEESKREVVTRLPVL